MAAETGGSRPPRTPHTDPDPVLPATDPSEGTAVDRTVFSGRAKDVEPRTGAGQTVEKTDGKPGDETTTAKPVTPKPVVPSTRASTAWITWCITAIVLVGLIVFILQNTSSVEVSFLWMDGSAPLGVMLLIAAVGAALITALLGTIRIAQLRRLSQRRAKRPR